MNFRAYPPLQKQKNISLIIEVLKENGQIRRSDLYQEVMEKQKEKYGEKTSYQVISRDVSRLLKKNIIKVVKGGPRSQILSLK